MTPNGATGWPSAGFESWADWLQKYRIELNAMPPAQRIAWLTEKIERYPPRKVVPPAEVLHDERVSAAREAICDELTERARIEERTEELVGKIEWPDRERAAEGRHAGFSIARATARPTGNGRCRKPELGTPSGALALVPKGQRVMTRPLPAHRRTYTWTTITCCCCGAKHRSERPQTKFCGTACKQAAYRARCRDRRLPEQLRYGSGDNTATLTPRSCPATPARDAAGSGEHPLVPEIGEPVLRIG